MLRHIINWFSNLLFGSIAVLFGGLDVLYLSHGALGDLNLFSSCVFFVFLILLTLFLGYTIENLIERLR